MWFRAASGLVLVLAVAACGNSEPRMPSVCVDAGQAGYEQALRATPGAVRLAGGVPISACAWRVRTDAELQNLGTVVHGVAERLADRARTAADADAARRLGYLTGAIAAGSAHSNGVSAELARRVAIAGSALGDVSPALARALAEGQDAGQARG